MMALLESRKFESNDGACVKIDIYNEIILISAMDCLRSKCVFREKWNDPPKPLKLKGERITFES